MEKTIGRIVDYAVRIADPEMVILFGSMSNGQNNKFSDVDLLIILEDGVIKDEIISRLNSFSYEHSLDIDVLVYSKAGLEQEYLKKYSFIPWIVNAGQILYKKDEKRLAIIYKIWFCVIVGVT